MRHCCAAVEAEIAASNALAPARVPYAVLNARGAAWKVAADIVRVQTNEMAKTARHKHLRRVIEAEQRARAGSTAPRPAAIMASTSPTSTSPAFRPCKPGVMTDWSGRSEGKKVRQGRKRKRAEHEQHRMQQKGDQEVESQEEERQEGTLFFLIFETWNKLIN